MASVQAAPRPGARRNTRSRLRPLPTFIGLAILAILGYWGWSKTHPADAGANSLITAPVTRGDLIETITATGSITPQTGAEVKIGSQITGRIKRLYADVGTNVKAGEVIADLDLPDITAQLNQAEANLQAAQTKLVQQQTGMGMQETQSSSAVAQAQANLNSARARLASAEAAAKLQTAQTPQDIKRAETALATAKAALSTAKSNQAQVQAGANLQVANAKEQLNQAKATAANSASNLKRETDLYKQGFESASAVDNAQAQADVNQSQVAAAQQNVTLVQQKVDADLQAARDQVTQAQQGVESAQAALVAARAGTYSNSVKLADVRDAQAAVRQAQANLTMALGNVTQNTLKRQDIQQAQDAVKAAQAQVKYQQAQVDKTVIRSPITGTVLQLAAQQGETLAAGLSAPTLIIVADLNRLQVDCFVDETDIGKVRLGQPAEITVDAFPKHKFTGHVTKIASGSTIQQGVVTYDVTIALENTRGRLKPDMTANVTLQTGKKTNVLLVPSEAVKVGTRGSTVNVAVKKDGKTTTETRRVRTGGSDGVNTEITDGLKEGDVVVLAGGEAQRRGFGPANPFGPSNNNRNGASGGSRGGGGGGRRGG